MPMNNNQKAPSAAARLAKLPVVHSACTRLSALYSDTKCSHPKLQSVCEGLESSAAALVSPVIVKLGPQICIANDVACKSLDWMEMMFPVLHTPTEQIVATAKTKMHEIRDVVSITANGTVDCVQHTVAWLMGSVQQADGRADQPLVERAISLASTGLDSALVMSEALMDRVLPPTEEDKEEDGHLLEGFEVATLRKSYPVRLVSLATKLWRRTYHVVGSKMQNVQVMQNLRRSSCLVQDFQTCWLTLAWSIQGLPQYVQHQLVSVFFFVSQMYNLSCPPAQQHHHHQPPDQSNRDRACPSTAETSARKDLVQVQPQAAPPACRMRRPIKTSAFDSGCNVRGCVRR